VRRIRIDAARSAKRTDEEPVAKGILSPLFFDFGHLPLLILPFDNGSSSAPASPLSIAE
jgi:hypothetical protein